jgi:hypothetical protein
MIFQAKYFKWATESDTDSGWTEVAFIPAWQLEEDHPSVKEREK